MPTIKGAYPLNTTDTLTFQTPKNSYYLIKMSAKAKSEKQRDSTDDEDITIKIDTLEFPKPNTLSKLINSPASFNGGKLHNTEQITYFVIYLKTGEHTIELIPQHGDGSDIIEVSYDEINIKNNQVTLNLNQQLENRDKNPWITFVLVEIGVKSFSIETKVRWHLLDGDDIKVIINGQIQKATTKYRKDWIIKTNPLNIFGKTEVITLTPNLQIQKYNYIELYTDKTPTLKSISFEIIEQEKPNTTNANTIQPYQDKIYGRDYNKLDEYILSAVNYWNDFFSKQQYPPPQPLDPNLVKAIIYRESTLGYDEDNNGKIDVMQVWDENNPAKPSFLQDPKFPANEFVNENEENNISYSYPKDRIPPDVTTTEESIFWGVRWLYHKAQSLPNLIKPYKRDWETWNGAIYNYNSSDNVEAYIQEVFSIYEKGIDDEGNVLWK